jgi:hypothetical protein
MGTPDVGDAAPVRERYGMTLNAPQAFAVERRRGWAETADAPPRDEDDLWDERRLSALRMEKPRPGAGGSTRLLVGGAYAAFRSGRKSTEVRYELVMDGSIAPLDDVQWADWDVRGRLLVATTGGDLQVREVDGPGSTSVVRTHPLGALEPDPAPPPPAAHEW